MTCLSSWLLTLRDAGIKLVTAASASLKGYSKELHTVVYTTSPPVFFILSSVVVQYASKWMTLYLYLYSIASAVLFFLLYVKAFVLKNFFECLSFFLYLLFCFPATDTIPQYLTKYSSTFSFIIQSDTTLKYSYFLIQFPNYGTEAPPL